MYSELFPDGLNVLPFSPRDRQTAFRWARTQPGARLRVTAEGISGIIEVYPFGSLNPRWCLWQTKEGRLQLDDVLTNDFALPYPTLDMALRFIAMSLAADPN